MCNKISEVMKERLESVVGNTKEELQTNMRSGMSLLVDAVEEMVFDVALIVMPVPAVKNVIAPAVSFHPRTAFAFGSARLAPVPPSARAKSVMPVTEPPVILTLLAFCVAIVPRPSVVR
jgi:hypothetical protein